MSVERPSTARLLNFVFFLNRKKITGVKIHILPLWSTFYPSNPPYDLPLPTLLKCLKRRFFAFFFASRICYFFSTKPSHWSPKKYDVFAFLGKLKNGPFWPNLGHFCLKILLVAFYINFIIRNVVMYNV